MDKHTEFKTPCAEELPGYLSLLLSGGFISISDVVCTADGFYALIPSVAELLRRRGISSFIDSQGKLREAGRFFDDWHLYALSGCGCCSLFKLREQEFDAARGYFGDGDTPGVTVSFVEMVTERLLDCLRFGSDEARRALNREINRVVAFKGQRHSSTLKEYFVRAEAQGPYLIAELYTRHIASFVKNGAMNVPVNYLEGKRPACLANFIDENNRRAGRTVCDHKQIFIENPASLSLHEKLAILATHTANTSFNSFAAEVQCHAMFLVWYTKLGVPGTGKSFYNSAIRADMINSGSKLRLPVPFYRDNSRLMRRQKELHGEF